MVFFFFFCFCGLGAGGYGIDIKVQGNFVFGLDTGCTNKYKQATFMFLNYEYLLWLRYQKIFMCMPMRRDLSGCQIIRYLILMESNLM